MRLALALVLVAACGKDEPAKPKGSGTVILAPKRATVDAAPTTTGPRDDDAALAELRSAATCDDPQSHQRHWCLATDGWAKAAPSPLPDAPFLVGLTVEIADGASAKDALEGHVALSVLALRDDAGRRLARITAVRPTNNDQATMLLEAMANLMILLKGNGEAAVIADGLRTYFESLPAQASYSLEQAGPGWAWHDTSSAELRKVPGGWWVAIATPPGGGGRWISLFTDRIIAPSAAPPPAPSPP